MSLNQLFEKGELFLNGALFVFFAAVVLLLVLSKIAARMQRRGWIRYNRFRGSLDRMGPFFLEMERLTHHRQELVLKQKRIARKEEKESGDPDPETEAAGQ